MILVMGPSGDPMVEGVADCLEEMGVRFGVVFIHDIPNTIRLRLAQPWEEGALLFPDGLTLGLSDVQSIYHRVGFANYEVAEDYGEDEVRYVNQECQAALGAWLNTAPQLIVNRPVASGTNASKPYQISLIKEYGFKVPETLVTNLPGSAREFYERHQRRVIYKSISYTRSIVQKMGEEDLERLENLKNCPLQLQSFVEGTDVRVHVVGDRGVFASLINSEASDYRYDKKSEIVPFDLGQELEQRCIDLADGLGLTLAGIDLRITPEDEVFCFEVNPSPAFSWYQDRTEQPITETLCELLIDADGA